MSISRCSNTPTGEIKGFNDLVLGKSSVRGIFRFSVVALSVFVLWGFQCPARSHKHQAAHGRLSLIEVLMFLALISVDLEVFLIKKAKGVFLRIFFSDPCWTLFQQWNSSVSYQKNPKPHQTAQPAFLNVFPRCFRL